MRIGKSSFAHCYRVVLLAILLAAPWTYSSETSPEAEAKPDPDLELAVHLQSAFEKLAQRVGPCVVSLQVRVPPGSWADELRRMSEQVAPPSSEHVFGGSGVIIEPTGVIITNEHVVREAEHIRVTLSDGRTFSAQLCGRDSRSDLAALRLTGDNLPHDLPCAQMGDSDKIQVGQWAIAVGNPFELSNTFTVGVISASRRSMPTRAFPGDVFYGNLIQTDAPINPGNSGGPLFDIHAKLIGINTMIKSLTGASQGFGFAIPSNHLKRRLAYLKAGGEIEYGWLGIQLQDLDPEQKAFNVPGNKGVLIASVLPHTPADRAGLQRGMVIVEFDSKHITQSLDLVAAVNETPIGEKVRLKALDRSGKMEEFNVRIGKRYVEAAHAQVAGLEPEDTVEPDDTDDPLETPAPAATEDPHQMAWRGMQLNEHKASTETKQGGYLEVLRVKKGSPADRAGLFEGARLTEIKSAASPGIQKFSTLEEFKKISAPITGAASIYVTLDGYVTVEPK